MKFVLIGFAGGIGVLLRFVVSGWGQKLAPGIFPLGTVIVNVTGCLLIGILGTTTKFLGSRQHPPQILVPHGKMYLGRHDHHPDVGQWIAPQRDRWMRTLLDQLSGVIQTLDVFRNIDLDAITRDTQIYACIWIAQIHQFRSLLEREGHRLRTINSEVLYRQPRAVIESTFSFLGIEVSAGQLDQIMRRPLWREHAKLRGYSFSNADREAALAEQYRNLGGEIDAGLHFAEEVLAPTDLGAPFGRPLVAVA